MTSLTSWRASTVSGALTSQGCELLAEKLTSGVLFAWYRGVTTWWRFLKKFLSDYDKRYLNHEAPLSNVHVYTIHSVSRTYQWCFLGQVLRIIPDMASSVGIP